VSKENDRILQDRLQEAKSLNRKSESGAIMHSFSLWNKKQVAIPSSTGNTLQNDLKVPFTQRNGAEENQQNSNIMDISTINNDVRTERTSTRLRAAKAVREVQLESVPAADHSNSNDHLRKETNKFDHLDTDRGEQRDHSIPLHTKGLRNSLRAKIGDSKNVNQLPSDTEDHRNGNTAFSSSQGTGEVEKNKIQASEKFTARYRMLPREQDDLHSTYPIAAAEQKKQILAPITYKGSLAFKNIGFSDISHENEESEDEQPIDEGMMIVDNEPNGYCDEVDDDVLLSPSPTLSEVSDSINAAYDSLHGPPTPSEGKNFMQTVAYPSTVPIVQVAFESKNSKKEVDISHRSHNLAKKEIAGATVSSDTSIQWVKADVIGEGTFGKVYSGTNILNGEPIAIKQLYLGDGSEKEVETLRKEINVMWKLDHVNIVR